MLALYRKYRPEVFGDVIAQDHVTKTLANQIRNGRVTHAYLFTGSRGTGKTTCARIFARAVNCQSPENGSPCGKCATCRALAEGNIDIIELDAASNNGVDQIREIIENVQYPPVAGKYKVYIIDEAHMLSASAFNALLKTLEEPPAHAIFILATTEVHKLPATVLSRCMRFDFRLVPRAVLAARLKEVYSLEGVAATDEAIELIAAAAEGSLRDLLSLADRCMNYSATLTSDDVSEVLGASSRAGTKALFAEIAACDVPAALAAVEKMFAEGKSVGLVAKDLAAYARDLLLLKTSASATVIAPSDEIHEMRALAEGYSVDLLASIITIFSSIDAELRYSVSPKIVLECAVFKAAKLVSADLGALEERIARLEKRLDALSSGAVSVSPATATAPAPAEKAPAETSMGKSLPRDARSVWGRVLTYVRTNESMTLFSLLDGVEEVELTDNALTVFANSGNYLRLMGEDVTAAIGNALAGENPPITVKIVKKTSGVDMDADIARLKKMMGDAKTNIKN